MSAKPVNISVTMDKDCPYKPGDIVNFTFKQDMVVALRFIDRILRIDTYHYYKDGYISLFSGKNFTSCLNIVDKWEFVDCADSEYLFYQDKSKFSYYPHIDTTNKPATRLTIDVIRSLSNYDKYGEE